MKQKAAAALVAVLVCGGDAAAFPAREEQCPTGKPVIFQLPGLPLEETYLVAKRRVPAARKCERTKPPYLEDCFFIDAYGQRNWLTYDENPAERFIWMKEAVRAAGRPIPFGIIWNDSLLVVSQKLTAAGFAPYRFRTEKGNEAVEVGAHVCTTIDPMDRVVFEFERGRLQSVQHRALWP